MGRWTGMPLLTRGILIWYARGWVKSVPTLYDEVVANASVVPDVIVMNGKGGLSIEGSD